MKRRYGEIVQNILDLIAENGPMTRADLEQELELVKGSLSAVISRMRKPGATGPKRLQVVGWTHEALDKRKYPRAKFGLGDGEDVPKPRHGRGAVEHRRKIRREYDERVRKLNTMNSVFNLGLTRSQFKLGMKLEQTRADSEGDRRVA